MRARSAICAALAALAISAEERKVDDGWGLSGCLWAEFENAYLSSSGTLSDTRPISMENVDWTYRLGDYGKFWGYGCFLGTLHERQHEYHRAAFNEFETGFFYGYDWKLNDEFTFCNSAGGVWNPLFGYRDGYRDTLWEYRYFQSLENPYLTPYWDILGLLSPAPSWMRIRMGVRRSFNLTDTLVLTPSIDCVWGDYDRYHARYGEYPSRDFLHGAFVSTTAGLKLEWFITECFSVWAKVRQFDTIDPQARRLEKKKTVYWAKPDYTIFTLGLGLHF